MKVLRAGVIGLGRKGFLYDIEDKLRKRPQSHVEAFRICTETELVAVADTDPKKAWQFRNIHTGIEVYTDIEKMLFNSYLDIVSIATPIESHCRLVRLAARYHPIKVIFVEKPITSTIEEAEQMIKTCKNYNVQLIVNHSRRFDSRWVVARSHLDKISPVIKTVGHCSGDPIEAGVHMADLFRWFGGDAPYEYVDLMTTDKPYDPYLVFELDIFGEKGRMTITDNGRLLRIFEVIHNEHYEGINELGSSISPILLEITTPMLRAIEHCANVALELEEPHCSGEDGLAALKIALEWMK